MKALVLLAIFLLASSCNGYCGESVAVSDGDTCASIATLYSISTDDLMSFNAGLDCDNLQVGQQVCVYDTSSGSEEEENSSVDTQNPPAEEDEEEQNSSVEEEAQNPSEEEQNPSIVEEEQSQGSPGEEESQSSTEEEQNQGSTAVEEQNPSEEEQNPAIVEEENLTEENLPIGEEQNEEIFVEEFDGNYTGEIVQSSHNTSFIDEVIAAHQAYRDKYGSPQLVWNYTLAYSASRWAQYLAANDLMVHTTDFSYGENIVGSDGVILSPTSYVSWWGDEERYFVPGTTIFNDSASTTGSVSAIGHFTQVVWRATTSVGCGMVTIGQVTRMVCQYYPPGNWRNYQIFVNYLSS